MVRGTQKRLKENMHIDRKPSSVIMVIDRIYRPIAHNMGILLLLRNEINTEIQLPLNSFINLIQITENLVANALKFNSKNGLVDVVFSIGADVDHSILKMAVTNTGKSISPHLVSAFNEGEQVAKLIGSEGEHSFGFRLDYVIQLASKEGGRIFVKNRKGSGTIFSLSFPLPDNYLNRRNVLYPIIKNSAVLLNGS